MKKTLLCAFIAASLLGGTAVAGIATTAGHVTPVNRDPANSGLNDPTRATPVGGNPGTTVGQQRQNVYKFAAELWSAVLNSSVDTRVAASFTPLSCDATSGVLGSAGANFINRDFGFGKPGIWYHAALANALAGENLNEEFYVPGVDDTEIVSRFNSNLGTPGCLTASGWYYGLDGVTPAGKINFLDVVMHEIGHGLGFQGFLDKTSGALYDADGAGTAEGPRSDVYTDLAYDNVSNKTFGDSTMDNATRATTMKTPGRLVWSGANVTAQAPAALSALTLLKISTAGNYEYGTAAFGPPASGSTPPFNGSANIVLANDATGADLNDGCEAFPAASLSGKIALMNRGTCAFEIKVVNAQNAGAVGAIIGNVAASAPGLISMADDATVVATIPAVQVEFNSATAIKATLGASTTATIGPVAGRLAGVDVAGKVQLYAPTVVAAGSTFSHYDTALTPNAIQEPSINADLDSNYRLDLSPALYQDLGWSINSLNGKTQNGSCDVGIKAITNPGIVTGANIQAADRMCRQVNGGVIVPGAGQLQIPARNAIGYKNCIAGFVDRIAVAASLTPEQVAQVKSCTAR